jgi:hypothetical protein
MVVTAVDHDSMPFRLTSLLEVDLRLQILPGPNPYQTTPQKAKTRQSIKQRVKTQRLLAAEVEEYQ